MANPISRQIAGDLRAQIASGDLAAGSRPVELQLATEQVAGDLGIARSSQVISRHERRFIGWHPWSMQTWYYPMGFVDRDAERLRSARDIPEGTVKYLADKLRIRQSGYRDWITVRAPNLTEAGFFKISADGQISVFGIFRTASTGTAEPYASPFIPGEDPLDETQSARWKLRREGILIISSTSLIPVAQ